MRWKTPLRSNSPTYWCVAYYRLWLVVEIANLEKFSASMWTAEESARIHQIARSVVPDIKLYGIPEGLQVKYGPDAIVQHLVENVPKVIEGN